MPTALPPANDKCETASIKTCFGEHAYQLKVNSTKSMVGRMLGAAAGLNTVCAKTIETGWLHPTINLRIPIRLRSGLCANQARTMEVRAALSNSLGFGGHNSALVITKYQ